MKLSLQCPACSRSITDLSSYSLQVTCPACQNHYGVVYGRLSKRSSIYETLLFLTAKLPSFYKRHYTLQITTPERNLKLLQFSIHGKADQIPVHSGDIVSVLYTMQGYVMKKLIAITNHTTGKNYILPQPVPSAQYLKGLLGSAAIGLVVCSLFGGWSVLSTALVCAIGILSYLKVTNTAKLTTPALESLGREGNRLIGDQRLLAQKVKIEQRITELNHEYKSNQVLIDQVENLKRKMVEVDQHLYSARIFRATGAVKILKQQIVNIHRLIREYRHALKMIEIEVETSWVADQLPDPENFTRTIVRKLSELKEIEDQNHFLKLQLAAYEEVKYDRIQKYE